MWDLETRVRSTSGARDQETGGLEDWRTSCARELETETGDWNWILRYNFNSGEEDGVQLDLNLILCYEDDCYKFNCSY